MLNQKLMAGGMAAAALASPATAMAADAQAATRSADLGSTRTVQVDESAALRLVGAEQVRLGGSDDRLVVRFKRTSRGFEAVGTERNGRTLASTSSAGPVAYAACPLCIPIGIAVSAAARAAAARVAGSAGAAAAARTAARATLPLIRPGASKTFPRLNFPLKQLEKKFRHAPDFGVAAARGAPGFRAFEAAIKRHMADPGTHRIFGTIKGKDGMNVHAVHFYNPLTRQVASFTPNGRFITAYYIRSDFQATRLSAFGHLGKVGTW